MRLLVACPKCRRQYDASGREIGSRFRCRCGEVLTVHQPEGHDAAVVRCSSCGAPRREGSTHCEYCNADFTIHEQQLDTICPHCFARVSDDAKFCDHCGAALAAEKLGELKTKLICPACRGDRQLFSRAIGGATLMECRICAGLWVENSVFSRLVEQARTSDAFWDDASRPENHCSPATATANPPHGYLPCPECGQLMLRKNYSHESGVIVDFCRQHGMWFDGDKLSRLLHWIHTGGFIVDQSQQLDEGELLNRLRAAGIIKSPKVSKHLAAHDGSRGSLWLVLESLAAEIFSKVHR